MLNTLNLQGKYKDWKVSGKEKKFLDLCCYNFVLILAGSYQTFNFGMSEGGMKC